MADDGGERLEHDRGLRTALLALEELRGDVIRLAAQVVAQGEALTRVLAAVPAAAPTEDAEPSVAAAIADHDQALAARTAELDAAIRARDVTNALHLELAAPVDKYSVERDGPPCAELLPLCGARCCRLTFALSTQDLDEGVIRWDHGRPYLIRQDADGACTHHDRATGGCSAYQHRPATCRSYDCRRDPRVWLDFDQRQPAPMAATRAEAGAVELADLGRERASGLAAEFISLRLRR